MGINKNYCWSQPKLQKIITIMIDNIKKKNVLLVH